MLRGFARIGAAVPRCGVVDFAANRECVLELWRSADRERCALVVFPELALSAYTARDLLLDSHLLDSCHAELGRLREASRELAPLAVVGAPVRAGSRLYNAAVAIQGGRVLGAVPKAYLPNYREFEETRWFRPGLEVEPGATLAVAGDEVPFGLDVLFAAEELADLVVGLELCEDFWVQLPPSVFQVSAGATLVCNLSASNFTIGKAELRRLLARSISDRGKCAYLYVAAGPGESSTDLAFDADAFVCENGRELAASRRFSRENQLVVADIDLELLVHERLATGSFGDCAREHRRAFRRIAFHADGGGVRRPLRREVAPHPFLPKEPRELASRCWEIFEIQTNALQTRLAATGVRSLVLGVSGGLDSTQAALCGANALDQLGRPRSELVCVTMPGLGTSSSTRTSAELLVRALGAELREISISEASRLVLALVGHAAAREAATVAELLACLRDHPEHADLTLENVQARLRTLVLMTIANQRQGIVVGTGDLSEKALGWATYAGDHIAMYDVNAGVPKTLIQFVIRWVANERVATWSRGDPAALRDALFAILDTPISPELLPADASGKIAQLTEAAIGPYELHDFFLYHFVRHGARPARILDLARVAFGDRYGVPTLKHWLGLFLRRFFANQFKRSCTADAPKVGMVALSPRGDWRMPSDARVASWLQDVETYAEDD
jgi:NAD+ synthase (glutamine-hydrolysing)